MEGAAYVGSTSCMNEMWEIWNTCEGYGGTITTKRGHVSLSFLGLVVVGLLLTCVDVWRLHQGIEGTVIFATLTAEAGYWMEHEKEDAARGRSGRIGQAQCAGTILHTR
jgi:hypothetical protein